MYDNRASFRAICRHLILRTGLEDCRLAFHRLRGNKKISHLHIDHLPELFTAIYHSDAWIEREGQDSRSGPGSTTAATKKIASQISQTLEHLKCGRLIDIGCGDFNWMKFVEGDWEYTGIDLVGHVIEHNRTLYETLRRKFLIADATREPLPSGDTALCREVLFHLSFADIRRLLNNCKAAKIQYLIATTDNDVWFNADIRSGDFRPLNLLKAPFRFPPPIVNITDDSVSHDRALGVWNIEELPELRSSWVMG